jgi:hypothetical protein
MHKLLFAHERRAVTPFTALNLHVSRWRRRCPLHSTDATKMSTVRVRTWGAPDEKHSYIIAGFTVDRFLKETRMTAPAKNHK